MDHEDERSRGRLRHRNEVLLGVEGHLRVQVRIDGHFRRRSQEERVAVGRGLGHEVRADVAAGAGLVVDDDLLLPQRREALAERAGHHVGGAAGREWHDDPDGLLRKGGVGRHCEEAGDERGGECA
jgi:hypothetical protein